MRDFRGKTAFITGGGSGVGLGQAKVFSEAGARIVIADIRADALQRALDWFHEQGRPVHGIQLDVTDRVAFAQAAEEAERCSGPIELLFNTAGVSVFGPLVEATYADYDWMMGVNFGGVVNGIQSIVPRMIAHGRGGHVVNTASMAAFFGSDMAGIYAASKFAVRGLSEGLRLALAKHGIGVSVLCPSSVNTNIAESHLTRPESIGPGYSMDAASISMLKRLYAKGMEPEELARHAKRAIEDNELYVIPCPEDHEELRRHFETILQVVPPLSSDREGTAQRRAALAAYLQELNGLQSLRSRSAP